MALARWFAILVLITASVSTAKRVKRSKLCITPNNLDGRCQTLDSCEVIANALASGDPQAADFARQSTNNCGFAEDHFTPLVCCGAYGTFTYLIQHANEEESFYSPNHNYDHNHKKERPERPHPIHTTTTTERYVIKPSTVAVNTLTLGPTKPPRGVVEENHHQKYSPTTPAPHRVVPPNRGVTTPSSHPAPFTSKTETNSHRRTTPTKKHNQAPQGSTSFPGNGNGNGNENLGHSSVENQDFEPASLTDVRPVLAEIPILNGVDIHGDLFPLLPGRKICGYQTENYHNYDGNVALPGEFPWLVLLRYNDKFGRDIGFQCAGTLINRRYVLTAAHCVAGTANQDMDIVNVRLGEQNYQIDPDCYNINHERICADKVLDVNISEVIAHPTYHTVTGNNDIALLRLVREVPYSDFVQPICLPPPNITVPQEGDLMVVAGWGVTVNGTGSSYKRAVQVPVVSVPKCKDKLERHRKKASITGNQICAGGVQGVDACKGDSGGPLMTFFKDKVNGYQQWYQEAVVSWGVGCGVTGYPGVYTRISRYLRWISNQMLP